MNVKVGAARILLILMGLAALPSAKAALLFDFSIQFTQGPNQGTVTGNLTLPFVSSGGSGTGAASLLTLTSIPASFGALAGGNTITSWANQVVNSFTVTGGTITSFAFFAATGPTSSDDAFAINSTGQPLTSFGSWGPPANLNELSKTLSIYGYNFDGPNGVSFTPAASAVPEPSSISLALVGAIGFVALRKRISK